MKTKSETYLERNRRAVELKPYVGTKEKAKPEIFEANNPTKKTIHSMTLFMVPSRPEKTPNDT